MTGPGETRRPPAVWFAYTPDRKGEHPRAHLSEFTGTLQADGYAGYDAVYKGGRVEEAACMAHVRRPFYDLYEAHKSAVAKEALERIAALYAIEEEIRGRSAEERREVRNAAQPAVAGIAEAVVRRDLGQAIDEIRYHQGHSLCAGALGGVDALLRRWPSGNRQ